MHALSETLGLKFRTYVHSTIYLLIIRLERYYYVYYKILRCVLFPFLSFLQICSRTPPSHRFWYIFFQIKNKKFNHVLRITEQRINLKNALTTLIPTALRPQKNLSFLSGWWCVHFQHCFLFFSGNENNSWVRICTHPCEEFQISGPKVQFYSRVMA